MPYLIGNTNYISLYDFLRKQQQWYPYSEKVWVQHIDSLNQCSLYAYQSISIDDCEQLHPFICEIGKQVHNFKHQLNVFLTLWWFSDPKVFIDPLAWHGDVITVAVIGCFAIAILLIVIIGVCWWSKSKYRQAQRLERRNSIRQSLHSLRSVGATPGGFSDLSYRRKAAQMVNYLAIQMNPKNKRISPSIHSVLLLMHIKIAHMPFITLFSDLLSLKCILFF